MVAYCCEKKCFITPELHINGISCNICESYGYCCCRCKTFTKYIYVIYEQIGVYVGFFLPISFRNNSIKFLIPEHVDRNKEVISAIKETIKINTSIWKSMNELKK